MKLYVIPVERNCNASCPYCINQFRKLGSSFLEVSRLENCLKDLSSIEAIEITGGGEPTLHQEIESIITLCTKKARTQIYTNGSLIHKLENNILRKLNPLCISRAHYNSQKNKEIMGIEYSDEIFLNKLNIKLSAVLYCGGIDSPKEVEKYVSWARDKAKKVVFRPLFSDINYSTKITGKIIPFGPFAEYFGFDVSKEKNPYFEIDGVEVEFETRSCSCENINPILHAGGELNFNWDSK